MIRRGIPILLLALPAITISASSAFATTDRADYDNQVNAICKSASDQVRQVAENPQATEGSILGIFRGELSSLLLVPPAPGDEPLISSWLGNRQQIQADVERHIRLDDRRQKRDNTVFDGRHSVRAIKRFLKWERWFNKTVSRIDKRVRLADATDTSVGSTLGASYCVSGIRVQLLILAE